MNARVDDRYEHEPIDDALEVDRRLAKFDRRTWRITRKLDRIERELDEAERKARLE